MVPTLETEIISSCISSSALRMFAMMNDEELLSIPGNLLDAKSKMKVFNRDLDLEVAGTEETSDKFEFRMDRSPYPDMIMIWWGKEGEAAKWSIAQGT